MKKAIAISIVAVILVGLTALFGVALDAAVEAKIIDMTVMSDVHFVSQKIFTADNFSYYESRDKMEHLSEAIANTVADSVIASGKDYLLISGDLTERGDRQSHEEFALILKRIEASGVQVFVINGNHDVPTSYSQVGQKVSAEEFKTIYAEFGYEEAISSFYGTLSYSADLGINHRLIAIDNIGYYCDAEGEVFKSSFAPAHENWVKEQIAACAAEGRTPVIMAHIPFKDHFPTAIAGLNDSDKYLEMAEYFADNGARYAFTGHLHMQDIKKVTSAAGNDFFDIGNPSMIHYPCAYSEVRLDDKGMSLSRVNNDYVDEKYLSEFTPDYIREELDKGLQSYCVKHMRSEIVSMVDNLSSPSGYFGSVLSKDDDTAKALTIVLDAVEKTLSAPIYEKDEKEGEVSIERVMKQYGKSIPVVEYKNIYEASTAYAASLFSGVGALDGTPEYYLVEYVAYFLIYNIDACADSFAEINSEISISVDMNGLVDTGVLECYESGLVPLLLSVLGKGDMEDMIKSVLADNFAGVKSFEPLIAGFARGAFAGVTDYLDGTEADLRGLIYDGVFAKYAPELVSREYVGDFSIKY